MTSRRIVWATVYAVESGPEQNARTWPLRLPMGVSLSGYTWTPPTDVFHTDDGGIVRVEIAGLSSATVELSYVGGRLVIAGSRSEPQAEASSMRRCSLKEIASGRFHVEVDIPWPVDTERVEVSYADGFLTVSMPALLPDGGTLGAAPAA